MDPYDEQRLREEVLYLHSLWHKGPPRQQYQPPLHLPSLHDISNPPQFKRNRPNSKKKGQEYQKRIKELQSDQGKEWPVNPTSSTSPAAVSGWPVTSSGSDSKTLLPSPEEQARLAANRAQVKALNATRNFLLSSNSSGDDEQDEYTDDDNDNGSDAYSFFDKLFMEDGELKEYYLKNYPNGDFTCLVCGGIGKKTAGKKYRDCVAVIQHSLNIRKNKLPHKAYGQVICKILGWEIDKLPRIVSDLTVKVNESLNQSCVSNGEAQENNGGETKDNSSINVSVDTENPPNMDDATHEEHQKKESGDSGNMLNVGEPVMPEEGYAAVDVPESAVEDTISHPKTVDVTESEKADHLEGEAKDGAFNDPDHGT